jgi:hypothetical protein
MRLLPKPLRDNWRWHLDPRDPDYLEPPSQEDLERQDDQLIDAYLEQQMEDAACSH